MNRPSPLPPHIQRFMARGSLSPEFVAQNIDGAIANALANAGILWSPDAPGTISLKPRDPAPELGKDK